MKTSKLFIVLASASLALLLIFSCAGNKPAAQTQIYPKEKSLLDGKRIEGAPIQPDVLVDYPQLAKALQIILSR